MLGVKLSELAFFLEVSSRDILNAEGLQPSECSASHKGLCLKYAPATLQKIQPLILLHEGICLNVLYNWFCPHFCKRVLQLVELTISLLHCEGGKSPAKITSNCAWNFPKLSCV